jgi:hypothetical protein
VSVSTTAAGFGVVEVDTTNTGEAKPLEATRALAPPPVCDPAPVMDAGSVIAS